MNNTSTTSTRILYRPTIIRCVMAALVLVSCYAVPKSAQIASAPIGTKPNEAGAKVFAEAHIKEILKDPDSAKIKFGALHRGTWGAPYRAAQFGWLLPVSVNSKNSYGGYTGQQAWLFCFRNGNQCVSVGYPNTGLHGEEGILQVDAPEAMQFPDAGEAAVPASQ